MAFLSEPATTPDVQDLYDEDVADTGFVMNASRLWAHQPGTVTGLFDLLSEVTAGGGFSDRERGILITATAATLGDSYCALAWGWKLSEATEPAVAVGVLSGTDAGLSEAERGLASWARRVARDPNSTSASDVEDLRAAGWSEQQVFAMTAFVALRIAFATVNDALGARPDSGLRHLAPAAVVDAVTWGRPLDP